MKVESVKVGIFVNLIMTLCLGVMTFVLNKYFMNYMGINKLGLMRLFTQMLTYLSLAELGLGTASTYALYKPLVEKDIMKLNVIFSTIGNIYKKISILILIIGFFLTPIVPFFIAGKNISKDIFLYWNFYVLNTALSYSFAKYVVLFMANQEFIFVRFIQGMSKIISQCTQILVIIKFRSFLWFIILLIIDNCIQYVFYKIYFKKKYSYIKIVKEKEYTIMKDMKNLFWHKISGLIVFNTDYIIISKFISLKMVGIYSNYLIIINMIGVLISIVTTVITPRIGNFIIKNDKEKIFDLWKKLNIFLIFMSVVLTYTTYKMINPFIRIWLGKEFTLTTTTIIFIMVNLFIQSSRVIVDIFKNSCGFFSDIHLPLLESLINIIFSLILVRYFGINGVIIGTIISNIIIILLFKPILVFKKCFDKKGRLYLKILFKYLILIIVTLLILENLTNKIIDFKKIITWYQWIKSSMKIVGMSLVVTGIIFLLDTEVRSNLRFIISQKNKE